METRDPDVPRTAEIVEMKFKPKSHHVSLQKFASRGSKGTQLQRKKEEDEVKRHKKSAALRKYAKLCKRDGIESDRVNLGDASAPAEHKPKVKPQPFAKAERTAAQAKEAKAEAEAHRQQVDKEVRESQKVREAKRQQHLKRTKSGQPVLNNTVKNLLAKIQASVATGKQ